MVGPGAVRALQVYDYLETQTGAERPMRSETNRLLLIHQQSHGVRGLLRRRYLFAGGGQFVRVHGQRLEVVHQSLEVGDLTQHGHLLLLTHKHNRVQ